MVRFQRKERGVLSTRPTEVLQWVKRWGKLQTKDNEITVWMVWALDQGRRRKGPPKRHPFTFEND